MAGSVAPSGRERGGDHPTRRAPPESTVPVRNPMDDWCPSPIPADTHHESHTVQIDSGLVGVHHHARVAERRTFDCVFAGERGNPATTTAARRGRRRGSIGRRVRGACLRNVPSRSRWRFSKRASTSSSEDCTSSSSRARMRPSTAPARESWSSKPSWPGTNKRITTRAGSGRSRTPAATRQTRLQPKSLRHQREPSRVLHRRQQRERRLRTLVEVHPICVQTVVSATRGGIPHRLAEVVVALEPRHRGRDTVDPDLPGVDFGGAGAGIGEGRDLDRLLVVPGPLVPRSPGPPPGWVTDARPRPCGPPSATPASAGPAAAARGVPERATRDDPGLCQNRVGVAEPLLWPLPVGFAAGLDRRTRIVDQQSPR